MKGIISWQKIVAAETNAAGDGGHDFWILFGDDGTTIDQIHGFAVDANGSITTTAVTGETDRCR